MAEDPLGGVQAQFQSSAPVHRDDEIHGDQLTLYLLKSNFSDADRSEHASYDAHDDVLDKMHK